MRALGVKLLYAIAIANAVAVFGLGVFAYFVRSYREGVWFDGLGRRLEDTPFIARFIFGTESQWAGWGFFALDFVVFWGGLAIAYGLATLAGKLERKPDA